MSKMVQVEITMEELAHLVYNYEGRKELEEKYHKELKETGKQLGITLNENLFDWQIKELTEYLELVEDEDDEVWNFLEYLSKKQKSK